MMFFYLIGEPGAGKTTLLQYVLRHCHYQPATKPFAHGVIYGEGWRAAAELGPRRAGGFAGTDGLSMSVQPKVVDWLSLQPYDRVIAEGDRLANQGFFESVRSAGYDLVVALLETPSHVAAARRSDRARQLGKPEQDDTWLRGRITKIQNLRPHVTHTIEYATLQEQEQQLRQEVPLFHYMLEGKP